VARLEAIADAGGVCLSGAAHDQVRQKLPLNFTDLGEQQFKNIAQPVRAYRVVSEHISVSPASARPSLALPDKPSIAVLPFTNLSGDSKEDYFSDGITEDIMTELSRFSELIIVARNSSTRPCATSHAPVWRRRRTCRASASRSRR
jgi:adenylate cyclase